MKSQDLKKFNIPDTPGVYFWKKGETILYIGKATSLHDRVRSYFAKDLITTRGPGILDMVTQSDTLSWQETDSVLEAVLLESRLIKQYQPKYNTKEKSDKSFYQVIITDEEWPKVMMVRSRDLQVMELTGRLSKQKYEGAIKYRFGPFPSGTVLREALKIIRKIFPFIDHSSAKKDQQEFYRQLGLVPPSFKKEVGAGSLPLGEGRDRDIIYSNYLKTITNIKLFFQGKKKKIIGDLEKQMKLLAKEMCFEEADQIKKKIFALQHINDIALIKEDVNNDNAPSIRIESFDIAHLSGKHTVGVMTVVQDGLVDKSSYRKFIIRGVRGNDDYGNLAELLKRRFGHPEWGVPDIIVVDGGLGQYHIAEKVLRENNIPAQLVSVIKDNRHKPKGFHGHEMVVRKFKKEILLANSESHRFAISFHTEKRKRDFLKD